jgi:hypothetical protein
MLYPLSYRRTAPYGAPQGYPTGVGMGKSPTGTTDPEPGDATAAPGEPGATSARSAEAEGFEPSMGL